jgi:zinc/manganese transport system substrate-binding protein
MKKILAALSALVVMNSHAALNVLACVPEWGSLVRELGGDKVNVHVATTALQDPHRVEARPSLIARARNADLLVCTGAQLEAGWVPLLQTQSGNAKIQAGQPGYFEAASVVTLIEKPASLDRAQGDVHPDGNPHLHLDPRNVAKVASALAERMAALDAAQAAHYRGREHEFQKRWNEAVARWEQQAAPLKDMRVVLYHKDLSYLVQWLGMREAGSLEPKPGIPPSTAHLAGLLERVKREPAKAVVRSAYNDPRPAEWFAERAKIPAVVVPYTVGGTERAKDLFGLYEDTIARLLAVPR